MPYYGVQPAAADVPKIKAALLIQYASDDARINDGWPAYETALKLDPQQPHARQALNDAKSRLR